MFDRTKDGLISQRNFGGHTYPRLAHVGDRTGLEMIRTLQDKLVHMPADIFMEYTITRLFKDGDRVTGALAYSRDKGEFHLFKARAVILRHRWRGQSVQDHLKFVGIHGRRPEPRRGKWARN